MGAKRRPRQGGKRRNQQKGASVGRACCQGTRAFIGQLRCPGQGASITLAAGQGMPLWRDFIPRTGSNVQPALNPASMNRSSLREVEVHQRLNPSWTAGIAGPEIGRRA